MQEAQNASMGAGANGNAFAFPPAPGAGAKAAGAGAPLVNMQRRVVYGGVLQRLRALMVNRMAKPEVRQGGRGPCSI